LHEQKMPDLEIQRRHESATIASRSNAKNFFSAIVSRLRR
jgi:hypothetical protein